MDTLRVGIIGFGFMGKMHTYGYKTIPLYYSDLPYGFKLVGLCVKNTADKLRKRTDLDFDFVTDNADDILENPDIDIVNVCTPNIFHKKQVMSAIKNKKHVYCDKPLTSDYDESLEIIEELKDKDIVTQMALQYRFFPATIRAKQIIDQGKLGNIISFRSSYLHSGSIDPNKPIGWKQDKKVGGGGVLLDLGSHILDLIYYLIGEYNEVFSASKLLYPKRPDKQGNMVDIEAEDAIVMTVKMKNGALGTVEASKVATGTDDELRFEIHGDKGALRFNLMQPNYLEFYDNTVSDRPYGGNKGYTQIACVQRFEEPGGKFTSYKNSIGFVRGHVHSLYNFTDCVYKNKKATPSFDEGAYIQYVMDKAYESDEKGTWVKL